MGNVCNCNKPNEFNEVNLETIRIIRRYNDNRINSNYNIEIVETGILTDEED